MFIISIAPIIGWAWPALAPIMLAAGGAMGFKMVFDSREKGELDDELRHRLTHEQSVEVALDDILREALTDDVKRGDYMLFRREDMILTVSKDERGKLRITATAPKGIDKSRVRAAGEEFARQIARQFSASRITEQLRRLNFDTVEETVQEDGEIRMRVRRWTAE